MARRIDNPDTEADVHLRKYLDQSTSFVMVAGAGSGKTTSLVKALAHIGSTNGERLRQRGQKVACITYTDIATEQIFGDVGQDTLFHVSTIHSFLWTLVKPFQSDIRIWVSGRIEERLVKLKKEREEFGSRVQQRTRDKNQRAIERYGSILTRIAGVKRFTYGTGSDYENGILGHDDVIRMGPALIQERALLRKLIAQKYPYFFVDESQDTLPEVVNSLKTVDNQAQNSFCLGFFGDPMQKIYTTGIGRIELEAGWGEVKKPENFRCSASVLAVINNIRRQGDDLQQTMGIKKLTGIDSPPRLGTARIFILPSDQSRKENLSRVREFIARENQDPLWISDEPNANVKILVIVHRMAARRLGFDGLYSALNDDAPESFKNGFVEGNLWALKPFREVLLPMVEAFQEGNQFKVIGLLRINSPLLRKEDLEKSKKVADVLSSLKNGVSKLSEMLARDGKATVGEVLQFIKRAQVIELDERFNDYLSDHEAENAKNLGTITESEEDAAEAANAKGAMEAYLRCSVSELWGYQTYIEQKSPYSTQHGIKGDEFERVLVILDDEEGTYSQFSYEKLLGIKPPSDTDAKNLAERKDSVYDRTRRLFYVCCSRAMEDLAVVLFTSDTKEAARLVQESRIFDPESVKILSDL